MDFGAPRRPSISPKSDANEDLHILNSYTFEKHQTFPNKKRAFRYEVVGLFMMV